MIELGDAEARAGDLLSAQDAFRAAAELARANRLDTALARAALGFGGRFIWSRPGNDRHVVAPLEAALQLLGDDGDPTLRVYVMARLACALRSSVDRRADSDRLSVMALELARQLGDPATLAYGLAGRFWAYVLAHEPA